MSGNPDEKGVPLSFIARGEGMGDIYTTPGAGVVYTYKLAMRSYALLSAVCVFTQACIEGVGVTKKSGHSCSYFALDFSIIHANVASIDLIYLLLEAHCLFNPRKQMFEA